MKLNFLKMAKIQNVDFLAVSAVSVSSAVSKKEEFQESKIVEKWLPLLYTLRLFGLLPFSFFTIREPEYRNSDYKPQESPRKKIICTFKFLSPLFILTVLIFGGCRIYYTFFYRNVSELLIFQQLSVCSGNGNITSPMKNHLHSNSVYWIISIFYGYTTPTVNIIEWLAIMLVLPQIAFYFNEWENFEKLYKECFDRPFSFNYTTFKAICFFGICFPLSNVIILEIMAPKISILDRVLHSLFHYALTAIIHLEDSKISLAFYTAAEAFSQIQKGITEKIGKLDAVEIHPRTIRRWLDTLRSVRDQAILSGKFTAPNQTIMTAYLSVIYTLFIFMAIETSHKNFHNSMFYIWLILNGLIRTFIKTYFADKIVEEEAKIVNVLAYWDISEANYHVKYEVKNIMDLIINSPSRIIYCGMITFDRKLIPSVVGIIVTYLIVLLQVGSGDKPSC